MHGQKPQNLGLVNGQPYLFLRLAQGCRGYVGVTFILLTARKCDLTGVMLQG